MPLAPRVLFAGLVDDAALFPPGNAPMPIGLKQHGEHHASSYGDVIGPFLCPVSRIDELTAALTEDQHVAVSLVVDVTGEATHRALRISTADPRLSLVGIEAADSRLGADAAAVGANLRRLDDVTGYLEVGRREFDDSLDLVGTTGWHAAKYRTGGTTAEAFPSENELAAFIVACARRQIPFKLTAGLHHAVRGNDPKTGYEHHGVLNVLRATAGAIDGGQIKDAALWLAEREPAAVAGSARDLDVPTAEYLRRTFRSFGCCGVTDPIDDLVSLGLLDGGGA
jgi:hypothetical protein